MIGRVEVDDEVALVVAQLNVVFQPPEVCVRTMPRRKRKFRDLLRHEPAESWVVLDLDAARPRAVRDDLWHGGLARYRVIHHHGR